MNQHVTRAEKKVKKSVQMCNTNPIFSYHCNVGSVQRPTRGNTLKSLTPAAPGILGLRPNRRCHSFELRSGKFRMTVVPVGRCETPEGSQREREPKPRSTNGGNGCLIMP